MDERWIRIVSDNHRGSGRDLLIASELPATPGTLRHQHLAMVVRGGESLPEATALFRSMIGAGEDVPVRRSRDGRAVMTCTRGECA